jgi:hypothetical protein
MYFHLFGVADGTGGRLLYLGNGLVYIFMRGLYGRFDQ